MKRTIVGYIPAAITFGSVPSMLFTMNLCSSLGLHDFGSGDFNRGGICLIITAIVSFSIGTILNLAFLAYAGFTGRLMNVLCNGSTSIKRATCVKEIMNVLCDGSTSEGIVSKGGAVTAIITFLVQCFLLSIVYVRALGR